MVSARWTLDSLCFCFFSSICCRSQRCPWRPWKNPLPFPPSTPSRPPLRALRWWRAATALNSGQWSSCVPWFYMNKYHVEQIGLWAECHTLYMSTIYIYNKPTVQSLIFALIHLHTLSEIKKMSQLAACICGGFNFRSDAQLASEQPAWVQGTESVYNWQADWHNCRLEEL